jgi:hypothetical protein
MLLLRQPGENGTMTLPTHYRLANVPFVTQRPSHLAWDGRTAPGVSQVVKPAQSRERTERPLLKGLISAVRKRTARMLRTDMICHFRCHSTFLLHPRHHADKRRCFFRWLGAEHGKSAGAKPSRAVVVRRRRRVEIYFYTSTVFGARPEREKIFW